jgi:hypothetical protein
VGIGVVTIVCIEINTWVILKGGMEGEDRNGDGVRGEEMWGLEGFRALMCVRVYSSVVIVEGAFVRDCRGIGVCRVGAVD